MKGLTNLVKFRLCARYQQYFISDLCPYVVEQRSSAVGGGVTTSRLIAVKTPNNDRMKQLPEGFPSMEKCLMFCMYEAWVNDYIDLPDGELQRVLSTTTGRLKKFSRATFSEISEQPKSSIVAFLFEDNTVRLVALNPSDEQFIPDDGVSRKVVAKMISHSKQLSYDFLSKSKDNTTERYGSSNALNTRAIFITELPFVSKPITAAEVSTIELPQSYRNTEQGNSRTASMIRHYWPTQKQLDEAKTSQSNKISYMLKAALAGAPSTVDEAYKSSLRKAIRDIVKVVDRDLQVGRGKSRWGLFHEEANSFQLTLDDRKSVSEERFTHYYTSLDFQSVREVFTCRAYGFFILIGDFDEAYILRYWSPLFGVVGEFYAGMGPYVPSRVKDTKGWKSLWQLGTPSRIKRPFLSTEAREAKIRRLKAASSRFSSTSKQPTDSELLYWQFMHSLMYNDDNELMEINDDKIAEIYKCAVYVPAALSIPVERKDAICAWWYKTPHTKNSATTLVKQFHDAVAAFDIEFIEE